MGIISDKHALDLQKEMSQRGWRKQEPVEYIGDETPLKLDQMAHHTIAEALMSPDRIRRVYPQWKERGMPKIASDHLTAYDLLAMSEEERQTVMQKAFELAANEDFETFDAFDEMDFADGVY